MGTLRRCFVLLSLLLSIVAFGQWEVDVEPIVLCADCALPYGSYGFGTSYSASIGRDGCDMWQPPLPPDLHVMDSYFKIDDFVGRAIKDFKPADIDTLYWQFFFVYRGVGGLTGWVLRWDHTDLPPTGDFRIAVSIDTFDVYLRSDDDPKFYIDWEHSHNMRTTADVMAIAPDVFYSHPVIRYIRSTASTEDHPPTPNALTLTAHPNPFNSAVEIDAPDGYKVTITDTDGRHVATLGTGSTRWTPGREQPSGVYLVKAEGDGESLTRRVVYLK